MNSNLCCNKLTPQCKLSILKLYFNINLIIACIFIYIAFCRSKYKYIIPCFQLYILHIDLSCFLLFLFNPAK